MSRMVWLGRWDPSKDKEINSKDERIFKEYLRDKYERKKWYRDPSEVRKAKSPDPPPASTTPKTTIISPPTKVRDTDSYIII